MHRFQGFSPPCIKCFLCVCVLPRLSMSPEQQSEFWRKVEFTVDRDVVRTDRSNSFFRGENNPNVEIMRSAPTPLLPLSASVLLSHFPSWSPGQHTGAPSFRIQSPREAANSWLHQEHEASLARSLGTQMRACGVCVGHMISNACPPPPQPPRRRILLNYAVFNPDMGYCQGMSDLVAPLLTEIQDESDTFWCFVGLMENTIFISSPRDEDMERQLVGAFCFFLVLNLQGFFRLPPTPTPPG